MTSSTRVGECPPPDVIAQLVSGSLQERIADNLFRHIDECSACQACADQLAQRADSLMQVVRNRPTQSTAEDHQSDSRELEQLIKRAQALDPGFDRQPPKSSSTSSVTVRVTLPEFIESLRRSNLLEETELAQFLEREKVSADNPENSTYSSSALAQKLIDTQILTPFQAKVLLRGRWKGLVLGNYVVLEKLGQGGMGNVFKARHRRMGRVVCIKVMNAAGRRSPRMLERFRLEARMIAALNHPNIVLAHDADESDGIPYLVMEYIRGTDLAEHVVQNGIMSVDEVVDVALQVAEALDYAHGQGVIHRDIKPHNLLLNVDEESGHSNIKILDMGLARFDSLLNENSDASAQIAMTNTGMIMGTVDYMSPEQAIDSRQADNRSDIYSLGCTIHYLLTGQRVYEGETMMARLVAHREQPIPSLRERHENVSEELDGVFRRMIAKNPDFRYLSMREVVEDLTAIQAGVRPPSLMPVIPDDWSPTDIARKKHGTWAMWIGSVGTICFCVGLAFMIFADSEAGLSNSTRSRDTSENDTDSVVENTTRGGAPKTVGKKSGRHKTVVSVDSTPGHSHSAAMRNGGKGRVLIVLPPVFKMSQKQELEKYLRKYDVEVETASLWGQRVVPEHFGMEHPNIATNTSLHSFDPRRFDAMIFIDGASDSLLAKDAMPQVNKMVERALNEGVHVAAVGEAWNIVARTESYEKCHHLNGDAGKYISRVFQKK